MLPNPPSVPQNSPLADVVRYSAFGEQRTGAPPDAAVADWLASRLGLAGLGSEIDRFDVQQLTDPFAQITIGDRVWASFPQWRHETPAAGLQRAGPLKLVTEADLSGAIALIPGTVPTGAYWPASSDAPVIDAASRGAVAVVVAPSAPNGGLFAYNRDAIDPAFPVPVLLVRPADLVELRARVGSSALVDARAVPSAVQTANVLGRLAGRNGDRRRLVVSTPRTGWFRSGAERGGGIALWLALAEFAARRLTCEAVFVATTGHEIGHLGMKRFMQFDAPAPAATTLWIHLGASIAARRFGYAAAPASAQQAFLPGGDMDPDAAAFSALGYSIRRTAPESPGETGEIAGRGYAPVVGFAGHHPSFHTPDDDGSAVDPVVLEAVLSQLQSTLERRFA